jgi:hypothetical protein
MLEEAIHGQPVGHVHLVFLVCLVDLVYLVCLVHLVSFVQPNRRDRPNRPDRPDNQTDRAYPRRAGYRSCAVLKWFSPSLLDPHQSSKL